MNHAEAVIGRFAEQAFYKLVGVKPESDRIRWYSVAFFEALAKFDRLHGTTYHGTRINEQGAALLLANHTSLFDLGKGYKVAQRSHRIPCTFTRLSFLDPSKQDSERVRARTGHKVDILNSGPMWFRRIIAALPTGTEAMPVVRGGGRQDLEDFLARGREKFDAQRLVACFVQETRHKDGKLASLARGVAVLAKNNPDVPIYPMGISKRRLWKTPIKFHWVSVGEPFTYNQMLQDPTYTAREKANFIVIIGDKIADQLAPEEKRNWYETQRPQFLTKK